MEKDVKIVKEYDVPRSKQIDVLCGMADEKDSFGIWFAAHIKTPILVWWNDLINCIKNHILFHQELKKWRSWDYHYQVEMFSFCLRQMSDYLFNNGHEIYDTRIKKIKAINELAKEIERDYEADVREQLRKETKDLEEKATTHVTEYEDGSIGFEEVENEYSKAIRERYKRYFDEIKEAREKHYDKIFKLIKGQDKDEINQRIENFVEHTVFPEKADKWSVEKYRQELYNRLYDGSGIENWWD